MRKNNRQLKNFLIYPEFQLRFVFLIVMTNVLIAALIFAFSYYYFINSQTLFGVLQYIHSDHSTTFRQELNQYLVILSILMVLFFILITAVALILSHRAAGPIYHFKKIFDSIANGEENQNINLRPKDYFKDVAESFNQMLKTLSKK